MFIGKRRGPLSESWSHSVHRVSRAEISNKMKKGESEISWKPGEEYVPFTVAWQAKI